MNNQTKQKLHNMCYDFLEEKNQILDCLNHNENRIREIDLYLQSIYDKEDSDFKVFSPRNVEAVFKDKIEASNAEKSELKEKNEQMNRRLAAIEYYLSALNEVQDSFDEGFEMDDTLFEEAKSPISEIKVSPKISMEGRLGIVSIQEEERKRIARDLHDTSLQNLTHIVHKIELCNLYIEKDPLRAKLELATVSKSLKEIMGEIRNIIYDLRPMALDDLGFRQSILRMVDTFHTNFGIKIITDIDDIVFDNELLSMTMYRIAFECCNNAVKHSGGTEINILIRDLPSMYKIQVSDNGKGFNVSEVKEKRDHHYGLTIINERVKILNGSVEIFSVPDEGTRIIISIPRPIK